jgi:hypothetical protein
LVFCASKTLNDQAYAGDRTAEQAQVKANLSYEFSFSFVDLFNRIEFNRDFKAINIFLG